MCEAPPPANIYYCPVTNRSRSAGPAEAVLSYKVKEKLQKLAVFLLRLLVNVEVYSLALACKATPKTSQSQVHPPGW